MEANDFGRWRFRRITRARSGISFLAKRLGMTAETLTAYNPAWTEEVERGSCLVPAGYLLRVPAGSGPIVAQALGITPTTTTARADTEGK